MIVARRAGIALALMLSLALAAWSFGGAPHARRNDLWRVVRYGCVLDQRVLGLPAPCVKVDLAHGFALVPGLERSEELLLVPTRRFTGVEDPKLLDPKTPNFWVDAWNERSRLTDGNGPVPDDWIALAVNSANARTQDQLHIHIDCLKRSTHNALRASHIGAGWTIVNPAPGRRYSATFITAATFNATSPFRLVANTVGRSPEVMKRQTIVIVSANDGIPGFYVLRQAFDRTVHTGGRGEELLDHRCNGVNASDPIFPSLST